MNLEIMLTINNGMNVYPIRTASIKLNLWDKIVAKVLFLVE